MSPSLTKLYLNSTPFSLVRYPLHNKNMHSVHLSLKNKRRALKQQKVRRLNRCAFRLYLKCHANYKNSIYTYFRIKEKWDYISLYNVWKIRTEKCIRIRRTSWNSNFLWFIAGKNIHSPFSFKTFFGLKFFKYK